MQNLERFETELGQRKTAFFGGEDLPGYLDYMMWPWMERIEIFPLIFQVDFLEREVYFTMIHFTIDSCFTMYLYVDYP